MPLTITFISLKKRGGAFNVKNVTPQKRAGRCVQCEQCEALKKEIRRSAEAIPPEICGAFAAEFCGDFAAHFAASP